MKQVLVDEHFEQTLGIVGIIPSLSRAAGYNPPTNSVGIQHHIVDPSSILQNAVIEPSCIMYTNM